MKLNIIYMSLFLGAVFGCKKKTYDLPSAETPVIEVINVDGNSFIFKNVTPTGGGGSLWNIAGVKTSTSNSVKHFFAVKGSYTITLTSNSKGGIATASTTIEVKESQPDYAAGFTLDKIDDFHYRVSVTTPFGVKQKFIYTGARMLYDTLSVDTVYFPFAGDYKIRVDVTSYKDRDTNNEPVFDFAEKIVTIASDDVSNPDLNNSIYNILTGGIGDGDGKTWIISPAPKLSGTGPWRRIRYDLTYYDYPDGLSATPAWANGALSNEFTFIMRGYQFIPKNGNATANWFIGNVKLGMTNALYADKEFVDPNIAPATFKLTKGAFPVDTTRLLGYGMDFNNKAYLGFFQNRIGYEICKISATNDSIWFRQKYNDNEDVYKDNPAEFDDPLKDPNARTLLLVEKK